MSQKAADRKELKSARFWCQAAKRDVAFTFEVRNWDMGRNPESCYSRTRFKHYVRVYRAAQNRLLKAATDYLANYKA
jgi:hypothetical protein